MRGLDSVRSDEPVETFERTKYVGSPWRTFPDAGSAPAASTSISIKVFIINAL